MECQDCRTTKNVELRWPGYGHRSFPRCEKCGEARLERERGNIERNFSRVGYDYLDAGEYFDEEEL